MARQQKERTQEWLEAVGAIDTTPRAIKALDHIVLRCHFCNIPGMVRVNNADTSLKRKGYGRCCQECKKKTISLKASARTGEKNPFYGRKHSEESKKKMSVAAKENAALIPNDVRKERAAKAMKASYDKYGGNPMDNPEIRQRHYESTHAEDFIESARERGLAADNSHLAIESRKFWSSPEGIKRKAALSEKYRSERNDPNGKFYKKRVRALTEMWADANRVEETIKKMMVTNLERYGAENWQQTEEAREFFRNNPSLFTSKGESEMREWIASLGFEVNKSRIGGHEIDIFIPELNIGIEYNGLYWHSDLFKTAGYHLEKTLAAKDRGVRLIHVFESEWKTRQDQVKSFLLSKFKKSKTIGARVCDFEIVSLKEAKWFLDKYHIQGAPRTALFVVVAHHQGEMVAALAVSSGRFDKSRREVSRFCVATGVSIAGGLSKMTKMASEKVDTDLYSWCDLRWSTGEGYLGGGWEIDEIADPSYYYTSGRYLVDRVTHEDEVAAGKVSRMFRIYDCGKIRFVFKRTV